MQTHDQHTIEALASEFATVLREWLTPEEFDAMRRTNAKHAAAGTVGICASHDYCDANVAMAEAFARIVGRESVMPSEGPQGELDQSAWDAAWVLAKARYLTATDTSIALHDRAMRHLINAAYACKRSERSAADRRAYYVAMAHAMALVR